MLITYHSFFILAPSHVNLGSLNMGFDILVIDFHRGGAFVGGLRVRAKFIVGHCQVEMQDCSHLFVVQFLRKFDTLSIATNCLIKGIATKFLVTFFFLRDHELPVGEDSGLLDLGLLSLGLLKCVPLKLGSLNVGPLNFRLLIVRPLDFRLPIAGPMNLGPLDLRLLTIWLRNLTVGPLIRVLLTLWLLALRLRNRGRLTIGLLILGLLALGLLALGLLALGLLALGLLALGLLALVLLTI